MSEAVKPEPRPDGTTPMVKKPSNPKDAFGIKKASLSCVSSPVLMELGIAMQEGACKYGRHNYRVIGVRGSVYYDATLRHLMSWWEGEDIDPDSGLSHVTKAIASLVVLRDAMMQHMFTDDRPPRSKEWLAELNRRSAALFHQYPSPVKPYTEADNSWIETASTGEANG
jgi:hypothetical protein